MIVIDIQLTPALISPVRKHLFSALSRNEVLHVIELRSWLFGLDSFHLLATSFLKSRFVFFHFLKSNSVSPSLASVIACLTLGWMGLSTVHINRVPMLMPHAPNASAEQGPGHQQIHPQL